MITTAMILALVAQATVAQTPIRLSTEQLRQLVDSIITDRMAVEHIPGAAFVLVEGDKVLYARGYGSSDLAKRRPVNPELTLFRIGSITKAFTATAALQLVDAGRVDLDAGLNRYLTSLRVPSTYPQHVTLRHLLSHTAAFDEIRPGTQAASQAELLSLGAFLRTRLVRNAPPGETPTYSTYGITLAGLLIEDVSRLTFEDYLGRHVLQPLGMHRSGITLSAELRDALAPGYEFVDGRHVAQPYEWYHSTPASSLNATPMDMAAFMIMHLNDGEYHGRRILSQASARAMRQPNGRGHPQVPGVGLGFMEADLFGVRILEHGGTVAGTTSGMVLLPDQKVGFFVVGHVEGSPLRDILKEAIVRRFFARPARSFTTANWEPSLGSFAGRYRWNVYCHSCGRAAPQQGPAVTVNDDSTIAFAGQRWRRVGPLLFVRSDGARYLGFRQNSTGQITHLFIDGPLTFERIPEP